MVKECYSETENQLSLPRDREVLLTLLHEVGKIIEPLNVIQQHQRFRVDTFRKSVSQPWTTCLSRLEHMKAIRCVGAKLWAEGLPHPRFINSYLDEEKLRRITDDHRESRDRFRLVVSERPINLLACASSLQEIINKQEDFLMMLFDLRSLIADALDGLGDTKEDTRKKTVASLPRNMRILDLYTRLKHRQADDTSERAFAIDFCEGDVKKATSLLKGVNRYRKRLEEAEAPNST